MNIRKILLVFLAIANQSLSGSMTEGDHCQIFVDDDFNMPMNVLDPKIIIPEDFISPIANMLENEDSGYGTPEVAVSTPALIPIGIPVRRKSSLAMVTKKIQSFKEELRKKQHRQHVNVQSEVFYDNPNKKQKEIVRALRELKLTDRSKRAIEMLESIEDSRYFLEKRGKQELADVKNVLRELKSLIPTKIPLEQSLVDHSSLAFKLLESALSDLKIVQPENQSEDVFMQSPAVRAVAEKVLNKDEIGVWKDSYDYNYALHQRDQLELGVARTNDVIEGLKGSDVRIPVPFSCKPRRPISAATRLRRASQEKWDGPARRTSSPDIRPLTPSPERPQLNRAPIVCAEFDDDAIVARPASAPAALRK